MPLFYQMYLSAMQPLLGVTILAHVIIDHATPFRTILAHVFIDPATPFRGVTILAHVLVNHPTPFRGVTIIAKCIY